MWVQTLGSFPGFHNTPHSLLTTISLAIPPSLFCWLSSPSSALNLAFLRAQTLSFFFFFLLCLHCLLRWPVLALWVQMHLYVDDSQICVFSLSLFLSSRLVSPFVLPTSTSDEQVQKRTLDFLSSKRVFPVFQTVYPVAQTRLKGHFKFLSSSMFKWWG